MYSRFKAIQGFGDQELEQLQNSTVAVIGLGATGSVIAEHLARHGVSLILIDRDYLEKKDVYTSNIYTSEQAEESVPKAVAAEEKLSQFTDTSIYVEHLDGQNIQLLEDADIIMDGTDNLETRFLINEYSMRESKPWIYTAAIAEQGYSMLFLENCFSCIFDEISAGSLETCETAGIMRETASIAASRSAWKAVQYLAGKDVEEQFEMFPGESLEVDHKGCEVCENHRFDHLESSSTAVSICGENKYQLKRGVGEGAFDRLREIGDVVADNDYLVRSVIDGKEFTLFRSGRAIVEARDSNEAEARFSEVLGG